MWGATTVGVDPHNSITISIHAPRVGSDQILMFLPAFSFDFNPRSPCGERLYHFRILALHTTFQSTLPVWGATFVSFLYLLCEIISIHAPRVGSDQVQLKADVDDLRFQSTLPVWGATF